VTREDYAYDTMKTKITMIAAAARQRPMNRSSRAVRLRSGTVPSRRTLCCNDTTGGRGKNHTAQEIPVEPQSLRAARHEIAAIQTRTRLWRESNQSLSASGIPAGKTFAEARDRAAIFRRRKPIARDRDRAVPHLRLQSHGKLKAIPNAPGKRLCAGLGGGAGRTQTGNQVIMEP
jgi:hypothetical protein